MAFYTIEEDTDKIIAHSSANNPERIRGAQYFDTEAKLRALAVEWPTSRLIRIWNSIPGVIPVTRFTSRKLALTRIWKSIQTPGGPNPDNQLQHRVGAAPKTLAHRKRSAPKGSRTEAIIALLKQPDGATVDVIREATGWQAHSVRGFISGTIGRRMKLKVLSAKTNGVRTYRVKA